MVANKIEPQHGHRSQAAIFWAIMKAMNIVIDIWMSITRLTRFGRLVATSQLDAAPRIKVPSDPKILIPAAQRALAKAEQRHRDMND
jgi:hypothetical protein